MAAFSYIDDTIADLVTDIGLSEAELKRVLKKDTGYINRMIVLGYTREEAEKYSFLGDLQNILSLMRSHQFSPKTAARLLGQTPDSPYEFSSTEEEEEEEDENEPTRPTDEEAEESTTYPSSPNSISLRTSCSITSSDDEAVERKRIKLDPDYEPSTDSEGTTPSVTPPSSPGSSDDEKEVEEEEESESSEDEDL
jgi:hypothetical protein